MHIASQLDLNMRNGIERMDRIRDCCMYILKSTYHKCKLLQELIWSEWEDGELDFKEHITILLSTWCNNQFHQKLKPAFYYIFLLAALLDGWLACWPACRVKSHRNKAEALHYMNRMQMGTGEHSEGHFFIFFFYVYLYFLIMFLLGYLLYLICESGKKTSVN